MSKQIEQGTIKGQRRKLPNHKAATLKSASIKFYKLETKQTQTKYYMLYKHYTRVFINQYQNTNAQGKSRFYGYNSYKLTEKVKIRGSYQGKRIKINNMHNFTIQ